MPLVGMTSEYLPFASVVAITTGVLSSVMRYAAIVTPCAGVEPLMPRALAVPDTVIIAGTFGGASAVVSPPPQPINKEARIAIRIPSCTPSRRVSSCSETHGSGIVRSVHSRGVAYMALSALGFSAMSVLVKLACRTLPTGEVVLARAVLTLVIVLYFPLVATPLAIPWAAYHWVWPDARGWLLLVAIGIATQLGQVFLTMALAIERAGRATSVGYLQICFAIVWQLVVFGVWPSWSMLAGAALIIAGTLAVSATSRPITT